ncbi:PE-PGRS family protein [Saccharomonospora sp. NPDC046836]|uniref:PE-PGRS family protein n=1 Tax=Saccharomonospora sp. NPDC046836 TaxID=3156921 RepID=UPI0033D14439
MSDRPIPTNDRRYEWYSHEAMRADVASGNEPAAAGEISREWTDLATKLRQAGEALAGVAGDSADVWRGPAGDALRGVLGEAVRWAHEVAEVSAGLGDAVAHQAEAAARARAEMPEPVPFDPAGIIRDAASSGDIGLLARLSDALAVRREEAEAARQQAIDVMYGRDAALRAAVPAATFATPPPLTAASPQPSPGHRGRPVPM